MNINFNEIKILKHLLKVASILNLDTNQNNKKGKYVQSSSYLIGRNYSVQVVFAIAEVLTTFNQLNQTIIYLANYRITESLKKRGINRCNHILYHLENYYIRTQSLYDKTLILVNDVFRLGNTEENCKDKIILSNGYLQGHRILVLLKELRNILNKFRSPRNEIIHIKRYNWGTKREEEFKNVEMLFTLDKDDIEFMANLKNEFGMVHDIPKNIKKIIDKYGAEKLLERTRFITTNEYTNKKKKELNSINNKLFNILIKIFDELVIEYDKRYAALVNKQGKK